MQKDLGNIAFVTCDWKMTRRLSIERTVTKALDMQVWWSVYSKISD